MMLFFPLVIALLKFDFRNTNAVTLPDSLLGRFLTTVSPPLLIIFIFESYLHNSY